VKEENLSSLFLKYCSATSRRPDIPCELFFTFPGHADLPASGRKSEKLCRRLCVFGGGSVIACHPDQGELQARAGMFQHEVFGKRQPIRPDSSRFDPAGTGSIGLARWPERMLALVPAGGDTSRDVALIDRAHRSSSFYSASLAHPGID
jgi:hypothetical protein